MPELLNECLSRYVVVDLFCGVGGLTNGFVSENFNVRAGIDFDLTCKYAYETNNKVPFQHKDLTITPSSEIASLFGNSSKILIGCAPCQAFSPLSHKYKSNDKWKLLDSFRRYIEDIQPDIVSMENVPNLKTYREGEIFNKFIDTLKASDYHVTCKVVNASKYGVPQRRNRLILIASKYGEIKLIDETHNEANYITVRKAIGHLPKIEAGETDVNDPLHKSRDLSPLNRKRIKATCEGGGWKDWDTSLLLDCHQRDSGKSFKSVYGRMSWDKVSPTLTTQCTSYGTGRFGHPEQDRAISLREAAILQSFPENYSFYETKNKTTRTIERHIGNAVPVLLGKAIAKSIKNHLIEYSARI